MKTLRSRLGPPCMFGFSPTLSPESDFTLQRPCLSEPRPTLL